MADAWVVQSEAPADPWKVKAQAPAQPWQADPGGYLSKLVGGQVRVTSDYRTPQHNAAVGGKPTSAHLKGDAFDFVPPKGMTMNDAAVKLRGGLQDYDQIVNEGSHVHVSFDPRNRKQVFGVQDNPGQWSVAKEEPLAPQAQGSPWLPVAHEPLAQPAAAPSAAPQQAGDGKQKPTWERIGDEATSGFFSRADELIHERGRDFWSNVGRPAKPGLESVMTPVGQGKTVGDMGRLAGWMSAVPDALFETAGGGKLVSHLTGGKVKPETYSTVVQAGLPLVGVAGKGAARAALEDGRKAVAAILAPSTVSKEATEAARVIRRAGGEAQLQADRAAHALLKHDKTVGNLPVAEQRALVSYIERRSKGTKLKDPKLQAAADTVRDVYDGYRKRIEYVLGPKESPTFIEDYYAHIWKEKPDKVRDTMNAFYSRQGTGRNLKKRVLPTIEDGLKAGLTPRTENPIETTVAYSANMSRYLATVDTQGELEKMGYTAYHTPGAQPKGWVALDGIRSEKLGTTVVADGEVAARRLGQKLYAPADVARVYNNWISKGLESGDMAPFYVTARKVANGVTQLKLGLSGYHAVTMAQEANISELARAFRALSAGKPITAAKAAAGYPTAFVRYAARGDRLQKELLGIKAPDALSAKVNEAYVRSGQRLRMDKLYRTREAGSYYENIKRGTFKRELVNTAGRLYKGTGSERAKAIVDTAGNLIQSTAAPIFEEYIPRLKQGAFAARMSDWLRENPGATQDEIDRYAIKLGDSVDNRFGELVQDNLFWHRWMKQVSQIVLLSPTWNMGTVREIGGSIGEVVPSMKGIAEGKGVTDKVAYVAALAANTALINGIATYLKTGEAPKGADFAAYRTGGTDARSGQPERAMMPGYQKDVFAFGYDFPHNIPHEVSNKLNPALQAAISLSTNKDYRGLPMYRPHGAQPIEGEPDLWSEGLDIMMPISIGSFKDRKVGTNIGSAERVAGVRPAPAYLTDPEGVKANREKYATRDWKRRIRADQRAKALEDTP